MTLQDFFRAHPRAAVAFSGGVDSTFLLWAAKNWGCDVAAYFVDSPFQPSFFRSLAEEAAARIGAPLRILSVNVLALENVAENPDNRCYFCKKAMLSAILDAAGQENYPVLLEGTNASDDLGDRPGMKAVEELGILSPLRLCGLSKPEIRRQSKAAGLPAWNLPAYACLATRIPAGSRILPADLSRVDRAEAALRSMGFSNLRLRLRPEGALLQLPAAQHAKFLSQRGEIAARLREYFPEIVLDPKPRPEEELP